MATVGERTYEKNGWKWHVLTERIPLKELAPAPRPRAFILKKIFQNENEIEATKVTISSIPPYSTAEIYNYPSEFPVPIGAAQDIQINLENCSIEIVSETPVI